SVGGPKRVAIVAVRAAGGICLRVCVEKWLDCGVDAEKHRRVSDDAPFRNARRNEISGTHLGSWNGIRLRIANRFAKTFKAAEEKSGSRDRATQGAAELPAAVVRLDGVEARLVFPSRGIELIIPQILKQRTVKLISPGLGNSFDDAAAVPPELGVI